MPDDAGVFEDPVDPRGAEPGDLPGIEPGESGSVAIALAKDREPGESGLRALEGEELEEVAVVPGRNAPLRVVVLDEQRVALRPGTAFGTGSRPGHGGVTAGW